MTKVTIIGNEQECKKELKPIQFVKKLDGGGNYTVKAEKWENIVLLCRDYEDGLDLMYAYDDKKDNRHTYRAVVLGHFNDGIV